MAYSASSQPPSPSPTDPTTPQPHPAFQEAAEDTGAKQAGSHPSGAPCLPREQGRRGPRQTPAAGELGAGPGLWGSRGGTALSPGSREGSAGALRLAFQRP